MGLSSQLTKDSLAPAADQSAEFQRFDSGLNTGVSEAQKEHRPPCPDEAMVPYEVAIDLGKFKKAANAVKGAGEAKEALDKVRGKEKENPGEAQGQNPGDAQFQSHLAEKFIPGAVSECKARIKLVQPEPVKDDLQLRMIDNDYKDGNNLKPENEKILIDLLQRLRSQTSEQSGSPEEVSIMDRKTQKNVVAEIRSLVNNLPEGADISDDEKVQAFDLLDSADQVLGAKKKEGEKKDPELSPAKQVELMKLYYRVNELQNTHPAAPVESPAGHADAGAIG